MNTKEKFTKELLNLISWDQQGEKEIIAKNVISIFKNAKKIPHTTTEVELTATAMLQDDINRFISDPSDLNKRQLLIQLAIIPSLLSEN